MIHPTAIIGQDVKLGKGVSVGPYSIIRDKSRIGDRTRVESHVLIEGDTTIGKDCRIFHGAAIGCIPQDLKYHNEESSVKIGDRTIIREYVTVNLATEEKQSTVVGSDVLLMAYVHIAHNCVIKDQAILANAVNLAGHVTIEEYAIIGGMTPIHQFVYIGAHCMVGGAARVAKDVLPYTRAAGSPLVISGLNVVGLQRRGFSKGIIATLKQAYRIIYRSNINVSQALERLKTDVKRIPEIEYMISFIERSERGISK
ncbi:MAG: acyl-[acyl-carrier-protein]--UDP-N-acetylglucosamine O-acyltransferase [Candidatus Cloacimonetes bacterium 4572_55]|nr:MAG: acyl-[acyl-carrier-protein]--UDP-N-acetylglucosamine O-acyltransferase [Candidatus Cloacimonetes bacterium 4572_55]